MQHSNRQRFSEQYEKTTLVIKEKKKSRIGLEWIFENMLTKRHCYKNEKAIHILKRKYLQITYLIKDLYPEHMMNLWSWIIRKPLNIFKWAILQMSVKHMRWCSASVIKAWWPTIMSNMEKTVHTKGWQERAIIDFHTLLMGM